MAIPDYETLMLPLLTIAGDGQEHRVSDVVDQLARDFKLAEKERQQHRHRSNRNRASPSDDQNIERANIRVTELLFRLQNALGISLVSLASFNPRYSMIVEPLFGLPGTLPESLDVFVLMPFKDDMLPVYQDHIKPTCESLELTVRRGDYFFTADSVVQDIWKAIVSARLIVADCTDRNPNVFYEIGLAHAIGKPTILLTQKSEDVPFDLRHLRYVAYQLTPRGMREFETTFRETVRNALGMSTSAREK
jgi:Mrr N-terminal domain